MSVSHTRSNVRGSIPLPYGLPPAPLTFAWEDFSSDTTSTPGTRRIAAADSGLMGVNWPSVLSTTSSAFIRFSTVSSIDALTPAARMETKVTSASPIISAAAVTAVRLGLRIAFSRASRPATPRNRSSGSPTAPAIRGTSRGLSSATAMNSAIAPTPSMLSACSAGAPPNNANRIASAPMISRPQDRILRRRVGGGGTAASSRIAARGGTRVARRAGARLATIVTMVPTSKPTMMVRLLSTRPSCGRSAPRALNSALMPCAVAMPSKMPRIDAIRPTISASSITERSTWPREAPIVRSSANSLVRCATVIENVLKMMNAPTNTAIPANTRSRMLRKLRLFWIDSASSSASC